ncbi:MAG: hypothetical protein HYX94_07235 [Chloroflexi bacterium]|nr:hypothetical protein [Chloroflexota bacterium]
MSDSKWLLLDPTAESDSLSIGLADRPGDIGGLTVGFVDNSSWWSWGAIFEPYRQLLEERFGVREVLHFKKAPNAPASSEVMEEIAAKCQVAIVGLGN